MSEDRVIGQFDVTLSEDLVKDVQTSGRPVKTEIWEQGEGKRGLVGCIFVDKNEQDVVRLRVTVFNQPSEATSEEGKSSTSDEKGTSEDAKVSSEGGNAASSSVSEDVMSQTEHSGAIQVQGDMSDQSTQAAQQMDEKPMQTEQQKVDEQCSQTEKVVLDQKQSQTEKAALHAQTTQTKVRSFSEFAAQTTPKVFSEQHMQTDIKVYAAGAVQTDIKKMVDFGFQTDPKPEGDFSMQTDQWIGTHECIQVCPDLVESAFQTDPKPVRTFSVQTENDTDEKFMQTENPISEKFTQTRVSVKEQMLQTDPLPVSSTEMQTDNPPLVDTHIQTCRDYLVDLPTQTDEVIIIDPEEQCENDCQTDFVRVIDPRNEVEMSCQTDPCKVIYPDQYTEMDVQTDGVKIINPEEMIECELQTEEVWIRDPDCQAEAEIQTEDVEFKSKIETVECEAQTNLVWIMGLTQAPEPEYPVEEVTKEARPRDVITEASAVPEGGNIPEGGEVPEPGEAPPPPAAEAFTEAVASQDKENMQSNIIQGGPVSGADAEAPAGTEISADQDTQKGIQTDPVTIIIGDSSFLVNKLKVYAQREMRFMEGGNKRGGARGRGRGRGRGRNIYSPGPPPLTSPGDAIPMSEDDKGMPVLNAESTPRGTAAETKRTPMSAPPAPRRPFTGLRHRTSPQDIKEICKTPEKKGRFNCPFCTLVFQDSATLYKHLREEHGSPRASNRRRRRKGTILIAEDGSLITDDGTIEIPPLKKDLPIGPIRANNIKKSRSAILHEEHMAKLKSLEGERKRKVEQGENPEQIEDMMAQARQDQLALQMEEEEHEGEHEVHEPLHEQHQAVVANGSTAPETIQISETPLMGQRAFSCPFCPKLFTKSSALYIHLQNAHKAVKQKVVKKTRPARSADHVDTGEELVEEYEEDDELVHEEEVELVVPAEEAHPKLEQGITEQEEGEIPLEEVHGKTEEGEVQLEEPEEGEVQLHEQQVEEGEVHFEESSEVVTEEQVVEEQIVEAEAHEEGEVVLEGHPVEVSIDSQGEEVVQVEEGQQQEELSNVIEEGEVPEVDEEQTVTKKEPEEEEVTSPRPRGRVRTRGGVSRKPVAVVDRTERPERGAKRRRSEPDDDDEEMPKLTRVTRRSVQEASPVRSTRRGPKILSPAKRGRR